MADNGHVERFPADAIAPPDTRPQGGPERELGDFAATRSVLALAALAVLIGAAVTILALGLLDLIGLITHLAYTGHAEHQPRPARHIRCSDHGAS